MNLAINQLLKLFSLSIFCTAMTCGSAYGKEFDLFADEATRPADYREKLVEIHDLTQKAIVYLGMPVMRMMGDLDDKIEFDDSEYWTQGRNTSVSTSFLCWGAGGYDVTLIRSDFRKYTGTLTASNCGSFGYLINGTATFEYDDAIWSKEIRPRIDFPLVFSFTDFEIKGGDGNVYTYTGKMQCDRQLNNSSFYEQTALALAYGKPISMAASYALKEPPSDLSGRSQLRWTGEDLLLDDDGTISKSVLINNYNCDFSDVAVRTQGQTHKINGIKFVSEDGSGPNPDPSVAPEFSGGVGITTGRQERLFQIGNEQYSLATKVKRSYFSHAVYGAYHFTNTFPHYISPDIKLWLIFPELTSVAIYQSDGFRFKPWSHTENDFLSVSNYYCDVFGCYDEDFTHLSVLGSGEQFWARLSCDDDCRRLAYRQAREPYQFALYAGCGELDLCWPRVELRSPGLVSGDVDESVCSLDGGDECVVNSYSGGGGGAMSDYFYADPVTNTVRFNDFDEDGSVDEVDLDDDNDDVEDISDAFPLNASESLDTDGDRIGNNADKDDDGDGVSDAKESTNGTNSLKADTDGDGSNDNFDAFPLDASEQLDGDGDGTGNNSDNCLGVANSDQSNADSDRLGNACDTDDDNDGVLDTTDAFPLDDTEQTDSDGDGTGNNSDNCRGLVNANQSNVDGDKNGDACDSDDDNDGVADSDDAFPLDATETIDTDGDGIGDNFDAAPLDPTVQKIGSRLPMWLLKAAKDKQAEQQSN